MSGTTGTSALSLEDRISKEAPPQSTAVTTHDGEVAPAEEPKEAESNLNEPEYDVTVKLADLQGDPNSPLYSVKRFEDLGL